MKEENIDNMLNTLRKHSPNWVDKIRAYINKLEKKNQQAKKEERTRIVKYIHQQFRNGKFMLVEKKRYKGKTTAKDLDKWWDFKTIKKN